MNELRDTDIAAWAAHCVVRRQGARVLVFNQQTDELHLIPERGFRVVQLCDGVATLGEIEASIAAACPAAPAEALREFFLALVERGILVIDHAS